MKFTKLILGAGLLSALSLTSCSSDEPSNNNSDGKTRYMTVNICDNNLGNRASDYEDGDPLESGVTKVRFFFFDDTNNGVAVKAGSTDNSYDVVPKTEAGSSNENISNVVSCDIIISTKEGDKLPSYIVAVPNFDDSWLQKKYNTVNDLHNAIVTTKFANPTAGYVAIAKGDFPMCNSVYLDDKGKLQFLTPVTAENICHNEADARKAPVNLYVERTVAKVVGDFAADFKSGAITGVEGYQLIVPAKDEKNNPITFGSEQLYIGVIGWSVTGTTQYAQLAKTITTTWTNTSILGNEGNVWNVPSYRRCFWEKNSWASISPISTTYLYGLQYNSWNDAGKYSFDQAAYVNPNAGTETDGSRDISYITTAIAAKNLTGGYDKALTQVIVKATILKKNGSNYEAVDVANWLGSYYTFDDLKTAMAGYAAHTLYWSTLAPVGNAAPAGATLNSIAASDIELKTHEQGSEIRTGETRRYPVYAQLTTAAEGKYWYDAAGNHLSKSDVNELLVATEPAKAWKGGATYYYFDIEHLGSAGSKGEYGVVRNHVYKFTISDIKNLGTPVYDPSKIIIPEKPNDQLGFIAANVNVLSWRIVNQSVVLE